MNTQKNGVNIWLAFWLYLSQPLFSFDTKVFLNPLKFWLPEVWLLERCWQKDVAIEEHRQLLKRCWQTAYSVKGHPKNKM
ncbi:MAG: hypothetical protein F6K19_06250 [Cyanothece sp. SIO1E1]|nr:hypothetical protein [Cyanothece sp. SIO1E1]